jgi:hypothetical protein
VGRDACFSVGLQGMEEDKVVCLWTKGALWLMGSQICRYRKMADDSDKLQCVII